MTTITDGQSLYWSYFHVLDSITVWFTILLVIITSLVPDLIIKILENLRDSELIRKIRQLEEEQRKNAPRPTLEEDASSLPDLTGSRHELTRNTSKKKSITVYVLPQSGRKLNTKVQRFRMSKNIRVMPIYNRIADINMQLKRAREQQTDGDGNYF